MCLFAKNPMMLILGALLCFVGSLFQADEVAAGDQFRIAIMQAQRGAAQKFKGLESYLKGQGIDIEFVATSSYTEAAEMFALGRVEGMFSGSGVAGTMIVKDVAYPLVRPVDRQGRSTYWAVVVAPKGSAPFDDSAGGLQGKKVICCCLASSGEFFLRSRKGFDERNTEIVTAGSHGEAIEKLARGEGDIAIIKNLLWDNIKDNYPGLEQVGSDSEQNPNGTLIVAKKADRELIRKIARSLIGLEQDNSPEAVAAREQLGIKGYILTSANDFSHTFELLRQAGVTPEFNFHF